MTSFEELEKKVRLWGYNRGLIPGPSAMPQYRKLREEFKELGKALREENENDIYDGIGDMLVVLTMIAYQYSISLTTCYEIAYNEIKDRKGKLVNGIFVKES